MAEYQVSVNLAPEDKEPVRIETIVHSVHVANQRVAEEGIEVNGVKADAIALRAMDISGNYSNITSKKPCVETFFFLRT